MPHKFIAPVFACLFLGCGALAVPSDYEDPVPLNLRLVGVPPQAGLHIGVGLWLDDYCTVRRSGLPGEKKQVRSRRLAGGSGQDLAAGQVEFEASIFPKGRSSCAEDEVDGPRLRFYRIDGALYSPTIDHRRSISDFSAPSDILVYSPGTATFSPWGPAMPSLELPPGYSVLHRTCAGGSASGFEVMPPDTTINLVPRSTNSLIHSRFDDHGSEAEALSNCGYSPPSLSIGHRVSFDRATAIKWSPDTTHLLYISSEQGDALTFLRALNLLDGKATDVATGSLIEMRAVLASMAGDLAGAVPAGPALFEIPGNWEFSTWFRRGKFTHLVCDDCFGMSLVSSEGVKHEVLSAAAGLIDRQELLIHTSAQMIFAWTRQCAGFLETYCTFALHRISITDGADTIVAVSTVAAPFAVSADLKSVALALPDGLFVRNIP